MGALYFNDTDVESALGFVFDDAPEVRSGVRYTFPTAPAGGREERFHLSQDDKGTVEDKRFTIVGNLRVDYGASAHTTLLSNLDALKWRVGRRSVDVRLADDSAREIVARLESATITNIRPLYEQRIVTVEWGFLAVVPFWQATSTTTVDFNASATACAAGTGPSWATVTIVGPVTNPILILRNTGGTELYRAEFTVAVPAGESFIVDMRNQLITLDGDNYANGLTGGDFFAIDGIDNTALTSGYPTLEISPAATAASAQAVYRKVWQ